MQTYKHKNDTVAVMTGAFESVVYDTFCDLIESGYNRYAAARMAFARWDIAPAVMPDLWAHMNDNPISDGTPSAT